MSEPRLIFASLHQVQLSAGRVSERLSGQSLDHLRGPRQAEASLQRSGQNRSDFIHKVCIRFPDRSPAREGTGNRSVCADYTHPDMKRILHQ